MSHCSAKERLTFRSYANSAARQVKADRPAILAAVAAVCVAAVLLGSFAPVGVPFVAGAAMILSAVEAVRVAQAVISWHNFIHALYAW